MDSTALLLLAYVAHCVTLYAIVKLLLTGKGIAWERRRPEPGESEDWRVKA